MFSAWSTIIILTVTTLPHHHHHHFTTYITTTSITTPLIPPPPTASPPQQAPHHPLLEVTAAQWWLPPESQGEEAGSDWTHYRCRQSATEQNWMLFMICHVPDILTETGTHTLLLGLLGRLVNNYLVRGLVVNKKKKIGKGNKTLGWKWGRGTFSTQRHTQWRILLIIYWICLAQW